MRISDLSKESNREIIMKLCKEIRRYLEFFGINESELDDILQETLITTWCKISNLKDDERLISWARVIAQNNVKRYRKRKSRELERFCSLEELSGDEEGSKVPDELIYYDLELFTDSEIYDLIMRLGAPASTIFLLHYVCEESFVEIGNTLKMNPNTVRSIALRGRERIRSWIGDNENMP